MRVLVIAILGSNDVAYDTSEDGAPPNFVPPAYKAKNRPTSPSLYEKLGVEVKGGCRAVTERLESELQRVGPDVVRSRLRFPILQPALAYIMGEDASLVDRVIVVVTDQTSEHKEDTLHMGSIAKRWFTTVARLPEFPDWIDPRTFVDSPVDLNPGIRFFDRLLGEFASAAFDAIVAVTSGGVPAMNAALQDVVLARLGPRARLLAVTRPDDDVALNGAMGSVIEVDTWPLRKRTMIALCKPLLERHEYSAARTVLDGLVTPDERKRDDIAMVRRFLCYAEERFAGAYERATSVLQGAELPSPARKALRNYWSAVRLTDIGAAAGICAKRGDLYGMLARLSSLRDLARRHHIRRLYGIPIAGGGLLQSDFRKHQWLRDLWPDWSKRPVTVLHHRDHVRMVKHAPTSASDPVWMARAKTLSDVLEQTVEFDALRNEAVHQQLTDRTHVGLKAPHDVRSVEHLLALAAQLSNAATQLADEAPESVIPLHRLGEEAARRIGDLATGVVP